MFIRRLAIILIVCTIITSSQVWAGADIKDEGVRFIGKITYTNYYKVDGNQIFVFDGITGEIKQLTSGQERYVYPRWSPDGTRIIFSCADFHGVNRNIFIVNQDGSGFRKLTDFKERAVFDLFSLRWNELGEKVLFKSWSHKFGKGWHQLDVSSGKINKSKATPIVDKENIWDKNRNKYAQMGRTWLEVYDSAGRLLSELSVGNVPGTHNIFTWSPDSRKILYCDGCSIEALPPELRFLDTDTGESSFIAYGETPDWFYEVNPLWSEIAHKMSLHQHATGKKLVTTSNLKEILSFENVDANKLMMRVFRNEIFARHGRQFSSPELQYIFGMTNWYKPDPNYSDDMLNDIEKKNIQFILDYEKKMGWR